MPEPTNMKLYNNTGYNMSLKYYTMFWSANWWRSL